MKIEKQHYSDMRDALRRIGDPQCFDTVLELKKLARKAIDQVIEPGQPVYAGKAALRAYVTASLKTPGFRIHWVSDHMADD